MAALAVGQNDETFLRPAFFIGEPVPCLRLGLRFPRRSLAAATGAFFCRETGRSEFPAASGRKHQYRFAIGSSSAGNNVITRQPLSVTTTSSSMRAAE